MSGVHQEQQERRKADPEKQIQRHGKAGQSRAGHHNRHCLSFSGAVHNKEGVERILLVVPYVLPRFALLATLVLQDLAPSSLPG